MRREYSVKVPPAATGMLLKRAIEDVTHVDPDQQVVMFGKLVVSDNVSLEDCGIGDGDTVRVDARRKGRRQRCDRGVDKPVICLYDSTPCTDTPFEARLTVNRQAGSLSCVFPEPERDGESVVWRGRYSSDGKQTELRVGERTVSTLFWEMDVGDASFFESEERWVVCHGARKMEVFEQVLARSGLSERERNEMVVYWLRFLTRHRAVAVRRFGVEEAASLSISGFPTIHRVFLVMKGVGEEEQHEMEERGEAVSAEMLCEIARPTGKFAVEWGATALN